MLGVQAAYHGVPLVGIPMYGDQPDNIAKAVHRGFGLLVPAKHLQVGASIHCWVALIALQDAEYLHTLTALLPALFRRHWQPHTLHMGFQTAAHVNTHRVLGLVGGHQRTGCWPVAAEIMLTRLGTVQAESLRAAVMRVATEPAFRRAARVVGARMRAHRVTPQQRAAGAPPCARDPTARCKAWWCDCACSASWGSAAPGFRHPRCIMCPYRCTMRMGCRHSNSALWQVCCTAPGAL